MGTGGKIRLEEGSGGGDHVGFKAPDVDIAEELIWELPMEDGNAGDVMITDGAGVLSWASVPRVLTYDPNGGTSGFLVSDYNKSGKIGDQFYAQSSAILVAPSGQNFLYWNTEADGSGTTYNPNQLVTLGTSNITLYAIWSGGGGTSGGTM